MGELIRSDPGCLGEHNIDARLVGFPALPNAILSEMDGLQLTAQLGDHGLIVGRSYRVTSIDASAVTFEEIVLDAPVAESSGSDVIANMVVDWDLSRVMREGNWYRLSPLMLRLLRLLRSSPGHVFSYEAISTYVWGHDVPLRSIAVLTKRLRYVIGDGLIQTVRPVGLRLATTESSLTDPSQLE